MISIQELQHEPIEEKETKADIDVLKNTPVVELPLLKSEKEALRFCTRNE
jgi:hypothetical protein